ncbi:MAG: tRNA uridine-5-carboxymethylaminomethyl(34) synthesis GTPase MnmE [Alistipes sp.]
MAHALDTIVAPATASGGALSLIRMSGPSAIALCDNVFHGRKPLQVAAANTLHYGNIVDGDRIVDDVVVSVFRAPHSYTGEESIEITCHGSRYIVAEILRLLQRAGARPADAGEFTVRAFLAGRIDLAQAEAVADMIAAESKASHALATTQMRGGYSAALQALRTELLQLTALLELELDFSEEDVEFADRRRLSDIMQRIDTEISRLTTSFSLGNAIKEGVAVAIVGAPNVGKSTLLNRLLGEERALVSEVAGTTRDTIEERVNIDGVIFRFIDTAGLHQTTDKLEQMGIDRTQATLAQAQIILHLTDATHPTLETIPTHAGQTYIRIINKIDQHQPTALPQGALAISAKKGTGINELCALLRATVHTESLYQGDPIVSNSRHLEALIQAHEALTRAIAAQHTGLSTDLLSEEIRQVIHYLGTITGEITNDEILHTIFSKFCIGK